MLSREEALEDILSRHDSEPIIVTNTGYISRAVHDLYKDKNNIFYMQGSMGLAPAIGLGIALNTDREVIVISGDASLLMHLGVTHTIRDYQSGGMENLFVYVLDNGCHESVGEYECSSLESEYPGVEKIYKISCDGKRERVEISFEENASNIIELLS
jgi:phosphonopyruvate decarboxylase